MKYWSLKKGDKVKIDDEMYEFIKMDGMYGRWKEHGMSEREFVTFKIDGELEKQGEYYVPKKH